MEKESVVKNLKCIQVMPRLIYGITCLSTVAYLCGIKLIHDYWYFILYGLCFFGLAIYKYKASESYLNWRKYVCLVVGGIFFLIAYWLNVNSTSNYLYFVNSKHVLVIKEGNHNRNGYIDIYEKKLLFKFYIDRFEVQNGHPLISTELCPKGGHSFKGSSSYQIGPTYFEWVDRNTLRISHFWGKSMTISLGP